MLRSLVAYHGCVRSRRRCGLSEECHAVDTFARESQGHVLERYIEGEDARRRRPALIRAISHAKRADALLVISRFNPFARDPVFLSTLLESGVEFAACDNPHANRTTLPLLACVTAEESRYISARTRSALKRRKRRGGLGTPGNLTLEAREAGSATMKGRARGTAAHYGERLVALRAEGKTLREIAAVLNADGVRAQTGARLTHTHVRRMLVRYEGLLGERAARKWEGDPTKKL